MGANPIAWVIPCHRVLKASGELGGYRWGVARKQMIRRWEERRAGSVITDGVTSCDGLLAVPYS